MDQSSEGEKSSPAGKPKFEPFRINVKMAVKDAPIFDLDNDVKEDKIRDRPMITLSPSDKEGDGDDGGTVGETKDNNGREEYDILEVNAELDSCIDKDVEDVRIGEKAEKDNEVQKPHKKHKKNEKREKKKKRKKEKSDEDTREKRHKKNREERKSRTRKDSSSSTGKRRDRSSSGRPERMRSQSSEKSRKRARDRSRERHGRLSSRGGEWRYSPSRFDTRVRSRSRSPAHRAGLPRVRHDMSPRRLSRSLSPKPLSRSLSPKPNAKRQKQRRKKSTGDTSLRNRSPMDKSPTNKFRDKTRREKRRKDKISKVRISRDKSPRGESTENRPNVTESPVGASPMKSHASTMRSYTEESPSGKTSPNDLDASSWKNSMSVDNADDFPDELSKDSVKHDVEWSPLESPDMSPSRSPGESRPPLESTSPAKSPRYQHIAARKSPGDVGVPIGVVVPYVVEDSSETENADGVKGEPSVMEEEAKEVYQGIGETAPLEKKKKKPKLKKKEKKMNGEKKTKKKKKKNQVTANTGNVHHISDDDLEDLLFTKTNKETKIEEVFHDTEVVTAKHNLRLAVVDLDPKPMAREEDSTATRASESSAKPSEYLRKPPEVQTKPSELPTKTSELPTQPSVHPTKTSELPTKTSEVLTIPDEHLTISPVPSPVSSPIPSPVPSPIPSPIPSPDGSPEIYEPDEPTQSPEHVAPLEPPPAPPVIPGILPAIPFLSTTELSEEVTNVVAEEPMDDETAGQPYSPLEHPILGSDYDSSPENHSTMHLSDISTKESTVESTVGVITRKEKIEDFLERMPGSFTQHNEVVDMDMSSPTNGANEESDDDIIEQLHKEFVKAQKKDVPHDSLDNTWSSSYEPGGLVSPSQDAGDEPVVSTHDLEDVEDILGIVGMKSLKKTHKSSKKHHHHHHNPLAKEKRAIEDALNKVHRQARVEDEMKHVLKGYYKHKDITKEEYKMILRKAVPQVANSNHGIDPERIRSLVKKYVAKYKGLRLRNEQHIVDNSLTREAYSPHLSQDLSITFSP